MSHLGLRVSSAEELARVRSRVVEAGLEPYDQEEATCCYARQDKFWVTDPDGNPWEAYLFLGDADRRDDADEPCCTPAGVTETAHEGICC